ncbi:MAG TPA: ABC transporter permease, partial [Anaerolineaceae bacterium]|nr:ABC transporter permease [Anaerolineaceae bacterium]
YHNEIDPAQVGYIEYLGQLYVDELNRRVLSSIAQQGQQDAASIQSDVSAARQNATAMRQALQAGNVEEGRAQQRQMRQRISTVALAVGASAGLLNGVQQNLGDGGNGNGDGSDAANILNLLNAVQESPSNTQDVPDQSDYSQQIRELEQTEADLADLETQLQEFRSVSPQVLTRPFMVETKAINRFQFTPMHFFTPGVITLLLQHITVTIAALSIVRERRAGTVELFRVSPITSGQILIGKYIAYMVFGAFIAAVLGLLLAYGLRVPMFGSWVNFAIVVALLLFSSLGIGFLISLVAGTESQAVQFAMIALLLAVFFSGFLLDLRYLYGAVRVVSWLLPATYGTILLQGIMLRGAGLNLLLLGGLAAIGIVTFIASWLLMRRQMAHE